MSEQSENYCDQCQGEHPPNMKDNWHKCSNCGGWTPEYELDDGCTHCGYPQPFDPPEEFDGWPVELTMYRKENDTSFAQQMVSQTEVPDEAIPNSFRKPEIKTTYRVHEDGNVEVVNTEEA